MGRSYANLSSTLRICGSKEESLAVALAVARAAIDFLERELNDCQRRLPDGRAEPIRYQVDWREETPGFKYNHWELRGVPFRLEVGPRDVAAGQGVLVRRIDRSKEPIPLDRLASAGFPVLVVSGGHSAAFDAVCDALLPLLAQPAASVSDLFPIIYGATLLDQ